MYFDAIERSAVTALLDGIYRCVESLEDIQFLVQYAPQVGDIVLLVMMVCCVVLCCWKLFGGVLSLLEKVIRAMLRW